MAAHHCPNNPAGVELHEAIDERQLDAYEDLALSCWELDEADRGPIRRLNRHLFHQRVHGRRWLAYDDGAPVAARATSRLPAHRASPRSSG